MRGKNIHKDISIRSIIILVFILSIFISVGFIGNMVFKNWMSSAKRTTEIMAEDMNIEIYNRIDALMHVPEQINEINHKLIENEIIDLNDEAAREKFFVGVLQSQDKEIYSFSYGKENGEYFGARRNEKGVVEIMKNNADTGGHSWYYSVDEDLTSGELVLQADIFDPRKRDWYRSAEEAGKPVFSPVYKHFIMDDLAVSAAWPIYNKKGELQGVLGTHMLLTKIGDYLKEIVRDHNGYAFIIERKSDDLIANSFDLKNFTTLEDGTFKRSQVSNDNNQSVQKAYEQYKLDHKTRFIYESENESLYVNVAEYHKAGLDWLIVSAIPENLLMADVTHNIQMSSLLAILAILISIAVYNFITNKLLNPIDDLIGAAEHLSSGDLSKRVTVVRNDEIGKISVSFNEMADKMYQLVDNLETKVKERTIELEHTNGALHKIKEDLYLILDSTAEGIYGIDLEGCCTFCNASCIKLLGYSTQDELLGENMHWKIHHSYLDGREMPIEGCKIFKAFSTGEKAHADDEVFWRAEGTSFDVEYHSYPQYKDGKLIGAVVTFMDITERKKNEENIKYLSCHDSLTGLMNRRCFEEELKKKNTVDNLPISIVFADINGLKLTNDIFGHETGDMLIKKSAEILRKACRYGDVLARVGGDEFILLLPQTEAVAAEKIIARVKRELSKERVNAVKCSMAMGFDTKLSSDQEIEEAMRNAENEMYREKSISRKNIGTDTINTIINTLHERSPREKLHSENVSLLCAKTGRALGLPETEIKKLREAGYLHDIGKIAIDEKVLVKKGILTRDEKLVMHQHAVIGYRILNLFEDTMDLADIVLSHHENWDGTGYPKELKGEEIPLMSRIISLAEIYDQILSESDTMEPVTKETVINEVRKSSGKRFDPEITEIFIRVVENDN